MKKLLFLIILFSIFNYYEGISQSNKENLNDAVSNVVNYLLKKPLKNKSESTNNYSVINALIPAGSIRVVTKSNSVIILRNAFMKNTSMVAGENYTIKKLDIQSKDGLKTTLEIDDLKIIEIHKVERASVYAEKIKSTVTLKNGNVMRGLIRFAIVEGENENGNLTTIRSWDIKTIIYP
jgi:hypothetical protein